MTRPFVRRKTMRSLKYRTLRRNTVTSALLVSAFSIIYFLQASSRRPRGCNVVQIWSHRGHLDSSSPESRNWTCDHVLMELQTNGIRHFDVDVLYYQGQSIVAHPTEMGATLGDFSPSPCSKLPLKTFIQKLKHYYGPEDFFITIEPKSAWTEEGDFLANPQDVVSGILDVLEEEPIPHQHCGIILQPWQLRDSRVAPLEYRINQHCLISVPLKRNDAPLSEDNFPADNNVKLIMPTIELFGNSDGDWFLKKSQRHGLQVVLWIVDTVDALRKSLHMRGVHGVISNHPLRLKRMYEEICHGGYTVRGAVA